MSVAQPALPIPVSLREVCNAHPVAVLLQAAGADQCIVLTWLQSEACAAGELAPESRRRLLESYPLTDNQLQHLLTAGTSRALRTQ